MATEPKAAEEGLTVAPIVGPDDERRFTDSGIEAGGQLTHRAAVVTPLSATTRIHDVHP